MQQRLVSVMFLFLALLACFATLARSQSNCVLMGTVTEDSMTSPQGIASHSTRLGISDSNLDGVVLFSLAPTSEPYQLPAPLGVSATIPPGGGGFQGGIAALGSSFVASAFDFNATFVDQLRVFDSDGMLVRVMDVGLQGTMYGVAADTLREQVFVAHRSNGTAVRLSSAGQVELVLPFAFSGAGPVGSVVYGNSWYLTDRQPPLVYEFDLLDLSAPPMVYSHLEETWYFSRCGDLAFFPIIGGLRVEIRNATNNMTLLQTIGMGHDGYGTTCRTRPDGRIELYRPSRTDDDVYCYLCTPPTPAPTSSPTGSPTTRTPTTAAPTSRAPTTVAPTTRGPTTGAPTTRAPSTGTPTRAPSVSPSSSPSVSPSSSPTVFASGVSKCVFSGSLTHPNMSFSQGIVAGASQLAIDDTALDGVIYFELPSLVGNFSLPRPQPYISLVRDGGTSGGITAYGERFILGTTNQSAPFEFQMSSFDGRTGTLVALWDFPFAEARSFGVSASPETGQLYVALTGNNSAVRLTPSGEIDFVLPMSFSSAGPVGSFVYGDSWYLSDRNPPILYEFQVSNLSAPPRVYSNLRETWFLSRCRDLLFLGIVRTRDVEVRNATDMSLLQILPSQNAYGTACRARADGTIELYATTASVGTVDAFVCSPLRPQTAAPTSAAPTPTPTLAAVVDEPTIVVGDATITGVSTISSQLNVTGVLTLNNTALQSEGGVITAGSVVITGGTLTVTTSKGEAGAPIEVIDAAQVSGDFALLDVMVSDLLECETATVEREPTQTGYSVLVTVDSSGCDALPLGALIGIIVGCVALVVLAIAIPLAIAAHRRKRDLEVQLQHMASKPM